MREQEPLGVSGLQKKLGRIDQALGKANRVGRSIGTPEFGRSELDISPSSQLDGNVYLDAAIKVGRVRKALAENAIPKLNDSKDQTQKQIDDLKIQEQIVQKLEEVQRLRQLGYLPDYVIDVINNRGTTSQTQATTRPSQSVQHEIGIESRLKSSPKNEPHNLKSLLRHLDHEIDDRQAQQILDGLTSDALNYGIGSRYKDESGRKYFTSAWKIATKAGFSFRNKQGLLFTEALQKAGIPIRIYEWNLKDKKHKSSILLTRDEERAIQALVNDQNLKGFLGSAVQLVCGEYNGKYPKSSQVATSHDYESPRGIFRELGINVVGLKGGYSVFLTPDCPVPVFRSGATYGYPAGQKEALKAFIKKRYEEAKYIPKTETSLKMVYGFVVPQKEVAIGDLDVSAKIQNVLRRGGIKTLNQLLHLSRKDLLRLPNLGAKSLAVIEEKLNEKTIYLPEVPEIMIPDKQIPSGRSILNSRERQILEDRNKGKTLREIGVELGISSERVRQIEIKARSQLRRIASSPGR